MKEVATVISVTAWKLWGKRGISVPPIHPASNMTIATIYFVSRQTPSTRDDGVEVSSFLTHLAREGGVAASTQNQALSALLFLYKEVLRQEIGWLENVERAKKPARLPVVLTRQEARRIFM